jgi:hypothetical protein
MTGTIRNTHASGGFIAIDGEGRAVPFSWCDCKDIGPLNVGHGATVQFYIEYISGRERAIGVRRLEQPTYLVPESQFHLTHRS